MLDAKDLRIGNLIKWISTNTVEVVQEINSCGKYHLINNVQITDAEPIELTEEWLLIFGFERHELDNWFYLKIINDWTRLNININGSVCELSISNHGAVINVAYVHQLQNLYYALTQTELTLKDEK